MIVFPNAKINIGLNIVNKRNDGYHDLETIFYPVPWTDVLEIIPRDQAGITFKATGIEIPGTLEGNFIVKAYNLMSKKHDLGGVYVHLHKNIPIGGGLGGGSSDVAFFVKGMNDIFQLDMGVKEMQDLVVEFGADCPFFIENKAQFATGIGDVFAEVELNMKGKYLMLLTPDIHVSTADAYAGVKPKKPTRSLIEDVSLPICDWKNKVKNDFEKSVFEKFPKVKEVKNLLIQHGALYASMSGSGATCYGIFDKEINISIPEGFKFWQGFI